MFKIAVVVAVAAELIVPVPFKGKSPTPDLQDFDCYSETAGYMRIRTNMHVLQRNKNREAIPVAPGGKFFADGYRWLFDETILIRFANPGEPFGSGIFWKCEPVGIET